MVNENSLMEQTNIFHYQVYDLRDRGININDTLIDAYSIKNLPSKYD